MDTFRWLKINSLSVFSDECVYTCVGIGWKKRVFGEWILVTVNMIHLPPIFSPPLYIYIFSSSSFPFPLVFSLEQKLGSRLIDDEVTRDGNLY